MRAAPNHSLYPHPRTQLHNKSKTNIQKKKFMNTYTNHEQKSHNKICRLRCLCEEPSPLPPPPPSPDPPTVASAAAAARGRSRLKIPCPSSHLPPETDERREEKRGMGKGRSRRRCMTRLATHGSRWLVVGVIGGKEDDGKEESEERDR